MWQVTISRLKEQSNDTHSTCCRAKKINKYNVGILVGLWTCESAKQSVEQNVTV